MCLRTYIIPSSYLLDKVATDLLYSHYWILWLPCDRAQKSSKSQNPITVKWPSHREGVQLGLSTELQEQHISWIVLWFLSTPTSLLEVDTTLDSTNHWLQKGWPESMIGWIHDGVDSQRASLSRQKSYNNPAINSKSVFKSLRLHWWVFFQTFY